MSKNNLVIDKEKKEIQMSRVFDAPAELLWKAHTDPKLITQWWGPRKYETIVETMDVRVGGTWRFINRGEDGQDHAFYGEYKALQEPVSITWTFNYEPIGPGHEITETMQFEELEPGKTQIKTVSRFNSIEDLEGMVQSGMEEGAVETWDRLSELAQSMHAA